MTSSPESFSTSGADGVRIVADRLGDPAAPAVMFLHGGGQTRRSWARAAAAVAKRGWQAVTVDFRGHGESDWSEDGDYRVTTFVGDVMGVLRQLPPRPVLVGASLGGFTSMLLAGELAPGTVRAVVLADAVAAYNPHRPRPSDLDGLRSNLRERSGRWYWHWDPKFIDGRSVFPPIEVTEVDRMHAAVAAILRDRVPMLLVRGQMSDLVTE
ncbi:MAG: hypothetical protein QOI25_3246, partial [Mycobacterium sp.]|nr:hypothetical protein [Mycobacterium sp.]